MLPPPLLPCPSCFSAPVVWRVNSNHSIPSSLSYVFHLYLHAQRNHSFSLRDMVTRHMHTHRSAIYTCALFKSVWIDSSALSTYLILRREGGVTGRGGGSGGTVAVAVAVNRGGGWWEGRWRQKQKESAQVLLFLKKYTRSFIFSLFVHHANGSKADRDGGG